MIPRDYAREIIWYPIVRRGGLGQYLSEQQLVDVINELIDLAEGAIKKALDDQILELDERS